MECDGSPADMKAPPTLRPDHLQFQIQQSDNNKNYHHHSDQNINDIKDNQQNHTKVSSIANQYNTDQSHNRLLGDMFQHHNRHLSSIGTQNPTQMVIQQCNNDLDQSFNQMSPYYGSASNQMEQQFYTNQANLQSPIYQNRIKISQYPPVSQQNRSYSIPSPLNMPYHRNFIDDKNAIKNITNNSVGHIALSSPREASMANVNSKFYIDNYQNQYSLSNGSRSIISQNSPQVSGQSDFIQHQISNSYGQLDNNSNFISQPNKNIKNAESFITDLSNQYIPYFLDPTNALFERCLEQLMLIIHTYECERNRQISLSKNIPYSCNRQYCFKMMQVLKHCENCRMMNCRVEHCASSRDILNHWQKCQDTACVLCSPVRTKIHIQKNPETDNFYKDNLFIQNSLPRIQKNNQYSPDNTQNMTNFTPLNQTNMLRNKFIHTNEKNMHTNAGYSHAYIANQNAGDDMHPLPNYSRNQNISISPLQQNTSIDSTHSTINSYNWKSSLTPSKRSEVVRSLVSAINPYIDIGLIRESTKEGLYQYALQTEQEVFESAVAIDQYKDLLKSKILAIHKEIEAREPNNSKHESNSGKLINTTLQNQDITSSKIDSNPKKSPIKISQDLSLLKNNTSSPSSVHSDLGSNYKNLSNEFPLSCGDNSESTLSKNTENQKNTIQINQDELVAVFLPIIDKMILHFDNDIKKTEVIALNGDGSEASYHNNFCDIEKIRSKLLSHLYRSAFEINTDINLLFHPLKSSSSRKSTLIQKTLASLKSMYEQWSFDIMKNFGYCCNKTYFFFPQSIPCNSIKKSLCLININDPYYLYQKCAYCASCFNNINSDSIEVVENIASNAVSVKKSEFKKLFNNIYKPEDTIDCIICGLEFHLICLKYPIWQHSAEGFTCDKCKSKAFGSDIEKVTNQNKSFSISMILSKYSARNLPTSQLSNFVENQINSFCEQHDYRELAEKNGESQNLKLGRIIVRVLYNQEKQFSRLKNILKCQNHLRKVNINGNSSDSISNSKMAIYDTKNVVETFKYRVKNIFVFQEIENNNDICLFSLIVHEYGSDCPEPNRNRIYISYIDSVKFFKPSILRTKFYHNIILSYLLYAKKKGFDYAHIWSCPPAQNDDYIFYKHPQDQKVPTVKMLSEWYIKMMKLGIQNKIIESYSNLNDYIKLHRIENIMDIPYFECDFWPNAIEDILNQSHTDDTQSENIMNSKNDSDKITSSSSVNESTSVNGKTKKKKVYKSSKCSITKKSIQNLSLYERVMNLVDKYKDIFFVISLSKDNKVEITDTDHNINCEIMDGREGFLSFAREGNFEFSTYRRAVYSTASFLYHLHLQINESLDCDICTQLIEGNYFNCKTCDDFDVCEKCYENHTHEHELTPCNSGFKSSAIRNNVCKSAINENQKSKTSVNQHFISVQDLKVYNKLFMHSILCVDGNCLLPNCHKIKNLLLHYRNCFNKRQNSSKSNSGNPVERCPRCKFITTIFIYHSKYCDNPLRDSCMVPKCRVIYERLQKQYQQRQDKEKAFLLNRINTVMHQEYSQEDIEHANNEVPILSIQKPNDLYHSS